jgi:hypothetical protein
MDSMVQELVLGLGKSFRSRMPALYRPASRVRVLLSELVNTYSSENPADRRRCPRDTPKSAREQL